MTTDDRVVVITALWKAVHMTRRLPASQAKRAVDGLHAAIEAMYNSHGDVRAAEAYENGRRAAEAGMAAARDEAFRAGMVAVMKRADYRDPFETQDPEELRSVH